MLKTLRNRIRSFVNLAIVCFLWLPLALTSFGASIPGSIPITAPIAPTDTADTFATHLAAYGKGGYRTVADTTARDAIPAARREEGMVVYVLAGPSAWRLASDLTTWIQVPALAEILPQTIYLAGDSITHGSAASTAANRWGNRLAAANGWASTNLAYGSAGMPDYIWQSYPGFQFTNSYDSAISYSPSSVGTNHQWALLAGYNDMRDFGSDAARLAAFRRGLMAWIGWVGTPTAKLTLGQAGTKSGTWYNLGWFGGSVGIETVTAASTVTFTNLTGDSIYLCYGDGAATTNGATFTVSIDGSLYATITATNAYGNREWRQGSDVNIPDNAGPIGNGKIDTLPSVLRIPNLGVRPHTMVVSNVSSATGPLRVFWACGSAAPQSRSPESGPFVWVGGCLRQATYTGSGSDAAAALYTDTIRGVVETMSRDGWAVRYAPAAEAWDPHSDLSGDGVHPSDSGMTVIARAFEYSSADPDRGSDVDMDIGTQTPKGVDVSWVNAAGGTRRTLILADEQASPLVDWRLGSYPGSAAPAVRYDLSGSGGLKATSGEQIGWQLWTEVTQSGTAGFVALDVQAVTTTKGSGSAILMRVQDEATSGITLYDTGGLDARSQVGGTSWIWKGPAGTDAQIQMTFGSATDRRLILAANRIHVTDSAAGPQNLAIGNSVAASVVIASTTGNGIRLGSSSGPLVTYGTGTPEGVVTAPVSSTFHRTDGGAGTSFYVKESGTGNTGWVAK